MKKLITIILLLLTFVTNAQVEEKVEPREEVISAPMLICSTTNRDKWFVIIPTLKKFNGIINKTYLVTMKSNIGQCTKDDILLFTFTDGKRIRITANNEENCNGIVEVSFLLNSIDVAFLESKTLESIRYVNGKDSVSFLYLSKPIDKNYFVNTFYNFKN